MPRDIAREFSGLIEELGAVAGFGQPVNQYTQLGHNISQTQLSVPQGLTLCRGTGQFSVGGIFSIKFQGNEQPELARLVDSPLGAAIREAGIKKLFWQGERQTFTNEQRKHAVDYAGARGGREIIFAVPNEKAEVFAEALHKISQGIHNQLELRKQFKTAMQFAIDNVRKIESAKAYIAYNPTERGVPYFSLNIEGMPNALAERIASVMQVPVTDFSPSMPRKNADFTREFSGGLNVSIAMNQDYTQKALNEIVRFTPLRFIAGSNEGYSIPYPSH